jgi:ubiquitin C
MRVLVRTQANAEFELDLEPSSTVLALKEQLQSLSGMQPTQQLIVRAGQQLFDDKRLNECDITDGDTLHLMEHRAPPNEMTIEVKTLTGKLLKIKVPENVRVEDFKEMIEQVAGTPTDQQRIIFSGKQLENERTLTEYNIQNNSTVHLVLRL